MEESHHEIKQIATQLLAGMLSNPHIYANISDEEGHGQQERTLIITAVEMAKGLINQVETNRE